LLIKWKDQFSIDGAIIDDDHRNLLDRINYIVTSIDARCCADDASHAFRDLFRVTEAHFRREEALQKAASLPAAQTHHFDHDDILASFRINIQELEDILSHSNEQNKKRCLSRSKAILYRWILRHIIGDDRVMIDYASAMQAADDYWRTTSLDELATHIDSPAMERHPKSLAG